jgi:hypothetical protein
MPYLPPALIEEAKFPKSWDRDIQMQIRLIADQYKRFYPAADYFSLSIQITPADANSDPVGTPGTTLFDPVYGESVDPTMTQWSQPQLSAVVTGGAGFQSADVEVFLPCVRVPRRFQLTSREDDLKLYGFDRVRHGIVFIPASILDDFGITVNVGDKIRWNNEDFKVCQESPAGMWRDSNIFLFRALAVEHYRHGS